jgi:hypothetical protein
MLSQMLFAEPIGQCWLQLTELALAFVLSARIGLEREISQKSAGVGVVGSHRGRRSGFGLRISAALKGRLKACRSLVVNHRAFIVNL